MHTVTQNDERMEGSPASYSASCSRVSARKAWVGAPSRDTPIQGFLGRKRLLYEILQFRASAGLLWQWTCIVGFINESSAGHIFNTLFLDFDVEQQQSVES